jgi:hypothetical protein
LLNCPSVTYGKIERFCANDDEYFILRRLADSNLSAALVEIEFSRR